MINTGSLLRVDQGDGRGRYTASWWEWDCGVREGKEIIVGVSERAEKEMVKEKKEKKRRIEKIAGLENGRKESRIVEDVVLETQETHVTETQLESQMEDIAFDEEV